MHIKRNISLALLIATLLTASYLRELTFLTLNAALAGHEVIYKTHRLVPAFLLEADEDRLMLLKWASAGLFTLLFFVLTASLLFLYFRNRRMVRMSAWIYAILCLAAGISLASGDLLQSRLLCSIAVALSHIVQSPLPTMTLFPVGLLMATHPGHARRRPLPPTHHR